MNKKKHELTIPDLKDNEVHVWDVDLAMPESTWDSWQFILHNDEKNKIERFVHAEHRRRALAVRVQIRLLLSKYAHVPANEIQFGVGEYGKPYLKNSNINFNLSHSGDCALVVVSMIDNIGVDIEHRRPLDNLQGLVERNFSSNELEQWKSVPVDEQLHVFFKLWTAKEAFIKATGRGLGLGLSRCSFSLENSKLLDCPSEYGCVEEWSNSFIGSGNDVSAGLAMKSKQYTLIRRSFS